MTVMIIIMIIIMMIIILLLLLIIILITIMIQQLIVYIQITNDNDDKAGVRLSATLRGASRSALPGEAEGPPQGRPGGTID